MLQLSSLKAHTLSASVMTATLANDGINPLTGHRCIDPQACRDVHSLMYSCGMYDGSGRFSLKVGLQAKSGVLGAMIVVVPNTLGLALFSPPLDRMGNPCKGAASCQLLDSLLHADSQKIDPRRPIGHAGHEH
ncbi:Glutaminase [Aphelenchoides fujianensis]|nr:Glutaminase [Aphelenchoides fujianensis]